MKKSLRWAVLARDLFMCVYCGRPAPEVRLEVDHMVPRSRGGRDEMSNLVSSCWDCNRGKRASNSTWCYSARDWLAEMTVRVAALEDEVAMYAAALMDAKRDES